jgi:two-component system LytT family response regulator
VRALIVGGDPSERTIIRQLLRRYDAVEAVTEARTGREASAVIASITPDVLFVDAELPDMNGFDLVHRASVSPAMAVVFVAASDTFAARAFEEQALDYLIRPILEHRLDLTMARVHERLRTRTLLAPAPPPADHAPTAEHLPEPEQRCALLIRGEARDVVVDVNEIDWIEADDYCVALYVRGKRRLVRKPLRVLERGLDDSLFVRVHRSAIVNLARVRELRHSPAGAHLILYDGTTIALSRRRRKDVTRALRRFTRESSGL